ncbi:MAG TPA: hypothetical protein VLV49_17355 [Terriglobales bacterium]|nr:hypothetical protein [Terriglobales bacterium]
MAKSQPPNTTGHQLFIPNELDRKIKMLAAYGTVDEFIITCIEAGLEPHWKNYVSQEYARLQDDENGKEPVRRSAAPDVAKTSAENVRNKGKKKSSAQG